MHKQYLLIKIFEVVKKERDAANSKRPIAAFVPVDCRNFFPSKSLRSFVYAHNIKMPESDSLSEKTAELKGSFAKINAGSVHRSISRLQRAYDYAWWLPRAIKSMVMKQIAFYDNVATSTGFSNLGLIYLPPELKDFVKSYEFRISLEDDSAYYFSAITVFDSLAFSAVFREEGRNVVESVMELVETEVGLI